MSANVATSTAAGTLFGAALAASGVYSPEVIIAQMRLRNFHMLEVFLSASATSALIIIIFDRLGLSKTTPRNASSLGWFGKYDGNILGGLLIGAGMSLSGACPGTSLVQAMTGVPTGSLVMAGGTLGGLFYVQISKYLRRNNPPSDPEIVRTIYEKFHLSKSSGVLLYESVCLAAISTVMSLRQSRPILYHSALGGLLIGGAQAASLLLTGNLVGVSSAYEEFARYFWEGIAYIRGGRSGGEKPTSIRSIAFAAGILAGSFAVASSFPQLITKSNFQVSATRAIAGGFSMVLGARIAGGCTSGHGISGMSMLSVSSIISVASMFAGGIGLAAFLY
ncbi:YeeE/YedE family protein [Xylogone sp. PMI_703]|nr:YeeE/YedE family protein [Xylogone sp. PMI_703]